MAFETNLQKFQSLLAALDEDHLGKKEFVAAFEKVINLVVKIQQKHATAIEDLEKTYATLFDVINNEHVSGINDLKKQVNGLFVEDKIKKISVDQQQLFTKLKGDIISLINQKIKEVDFKVEQRAKPGPPGPRGEPGRPPLSNEIDLAIKPTVESFRKSWEEKVQQAMARRGVGVGGGPSANAVQYVDLSSQLNGSTTTFNTPKFRQALLMIGTEFPILYRPTTDFTVKNGQVSLVTDQVSAPAAGQSLILLYIK